MEGRAQLMCPWGGCGHSVLENLMLVEWKYGTYNMLIPNYEAIQSLSLKEGVKARLLLFTVA